MNATSNLLRSYWNDPRELTRLLLGIWGLGALAAIWHIASRYPPSDGAMVLAFAVIAVAILAAPIPARTRLVLALVVGLMARLVAGNSIAGIPPADDPGAYNRLADNLLAGRGLVIDDPVYGAG